MKIYRLIERRNDEVRKITYEVKIEKSTGDAIVKMLDIRKGFDETSIFIGSDITETKRGWSFKSWWLTSKPIKIFLPRENFEKVEME